MLERFLLIRAFRVRGLVLEAKRDVLAARMNTTWQGDGTCLSGVETFLRMWWALELNKTRLLSLHIECIARL
jgi:hypothetical protein